MLRSLFVSLSCRSRWMNSVECLWWFEQWSHECRLWVRFHGDFRMNGWSGWVSMRAGVQGRERCKRIGCGSHTRQEKKGSNPIMENIEGVFVVVLIWHIWLSDARWPNPTKYHSFLIGVLRFWIRITLYISIVVHPFIHHVPGMNIMKYGNNFDHIQLCRYFWASSHHFTPFLPDWDE